MVSMLSAVKETVQKRAEPEKCNKTIDFYHCSVPESFVLASSKTRFCSDIDNMMRVTSGSGSGFVICRDHYWLLS